MQGTLLVCGDAGIPQQWLTDAYTVKTPSPKLDSALWWGKDKDQGCLWFLGVFSFKDTLTLSVSWRRNHPTLSLWSGLSRAQS